MTAKTKVPVETTSLTTLPAGFKRAPDLRAAIAVLPKKTETIVHAHSFGFPNLRKR